MDDGRWVTTAMGGSMALPIPTDPGPGGGGMEGGSLGIRGKKVVRVVAWQPIPGGGAGEKDTEEGGADEQIPVLARVSACFKPKKGGAARNRWRTD